MYLVPLEFFRSSSSTVLWELLSSVQSHLARTPGLSLLVLTCNRVKGLCEGDRVKGGHGLGLVTALIRRFCGDCTHYGDVIA